MGAAVGERRGPCRAAVGGRSAGRHRRARALRRRGARHSAGRRVQGDRARQRCRLAGAARSGRDDSRLRGVEGAAARRGHRAPARVGSDRGERGGERSRDDRAARHAARARRARARRRPGRGHSHPERPLDRAGGRRTRSPRPRPLARRAPRARHDRRGDSHARARRPLRGAARAVRHAAPPRRAPVLVERQLAAESRFHRAPRHDRVARSNARHGGARYRRPVRRWPTRRRSTRTTAPWR